MNPAPDQPDRVNGPMVERIARVVYREAMTPGPDQPHRIARAVLQAMREPSEVMKLAGCDVLICNKRKSWAMAAGDAYQAMVDAALGEQP